MNVYLWLYQGWETFLKNFTKTKNLKWSINKAERSQKNTKNIYIKKKTKTLNDTITWKKKNNNIHFVIEKW